MPAESMDYTFPLRGINDAWAFGKQPEGTTPDAENVMPFDSLDSRARGGQRPGLSKYYAAQHNGSAAIQRITSITSIVLDPGTFGQFINEDAPFWSAFAADWTHYVSDFESASTENPTFDTLITADSESPAIVNNEIKIVDPGAGNTFSSVHIYTGREYEWTGSYTISMDMQREDVSSAGVAFFATHVALFRVNREFNGEFYGLRFRTEMGRYGGGNEEVGDMVIDLIRGDGTGYDSLSFQRTDPGDGDIRKAVYSALEAGQTFAIEISADGTIVVDTGDVPGGPWIFPPDPDEGMTDYGSNHGVGFGFVSEYTMDPLHFSRFVAEEDGGDAVGAGYRDTESGRTYKIVAVSDGDIFFGRRPGSLTVAANGANVVATSGRVDAQPAFGKIHFADGSPSHYRYFDNADDTVKLWTTTSSNALPCDATSTNTTYDIATATTSPKVFTYTGDLTGVITGADWIKVSDSSDNDGIYSVVSVSYSNPTTTITVRQNVTNSAASGSIQLCDLACDIVKLYRGRLVLAGLASEPHNWFMSAVGRHFDFDYGATVSATMAVAGNNTNAGECPDIITCLAPYSDDLMFIGGDHTLWLMRGDPAEKGRIDNISYQTGISGPDAYAFDPNGVFYFFGQGTIWRMSIEGSPEPLSRNRMDRVFGAINLTGNTVRLAWDNARHGLFIFVVPDAERVTTHYYWDERTDSFWKITFPAAQGPTAVFPFDGDQPDDNALLFGGWDGYIRRVDPSATNDDGTAISSYVYYPLISAGGSLRNTLVSSITAILDTNSDDVVLTAYAEDTPQKALESTTPRFVRTLPAGRTRIVNRVAGNAIALKLSNSVDETTWAIENLIVTAKATGLTRKNQL